jgi:hypothetical protein
MTIHPAEQFGDTLKTRFLGGQLHGQLQASLANGSSVTVDFSRVRGLGHSFADECFGVLFAEHGPELFRTRLHLTGMNENVKAVLRLVFTDRRNPVRH